MRRPEAFHGAEASKDKSTTEIDTTPETAPTPWFAAALVVLRTVRASALWPALGEQMRVARRRACFDLTSRSPLNARLYAPPPQRVPGTAGRPRVRGEALPRPARMLEGRARRVTLTIYGRRDTVRIAEVVARGFRGPRRPLKVFVTEALRGGRGRQAFFSTDTRQAATTVLREFSGRWSIEMEQPWGSSSR